MAMSSITATEVGTFFLSLIVPIATGIVAAGFTAYFALNRFYREKWWEKKFVAYNSVLDNLFEINEIYKAASLYYEKEWIAQNNDNYSFPEDNVDWDKFHQIKAQLLRMYAFSPISLSLASRTLLKSFFEADKEAERRTFEDGEHDFRIYDSMSSKIEEIIEAIVRDAESELKFK